MPGNDVVNETKQLAVDRNPYKNESLFEAEYKLNETNFANFENDTNRTLQFYLKILLENLTSHYYMEFHSGPSQWEIMIIFFYSLIVIVSFFGNCLVCKIVFWNSSMRSTTNIYIGNLSVSDLLMTVLNIPLQLTQVLSKNWPFNRFLCRCLPFFQGLSVNVSSFTMACIALDRYQVIAYPLKPRPGMTSIILRIILIWIIASMASSPYPIIADIEEDFTYVKITRCRLIYPKPKYEARQLFTIIIMAVQYLIPLSITGVTYFRLCCIIWRRRTIGVVSESQRHQRYLAKWKTIKMLIIVFLVFVICWFPLNMYHVYQDFRGDVGPYKHNPRIFLICHWFAMSSICYNPFVYCWLNEGFRTMAKYYILFFLRIRPKNFSTESLIFFRNRTVGKHKNKHSSNLLTLSENVNSINSSGKAGLNCTKMKIRDFRRSVTKNGTLDNEEIEMNSILNYVNGNEKNLDMKMDDYTAGTKESVV